MYHECYHVLFSDPHLIGAVQCSRKTQAIPADLIDCVTSIMIVINTIVARGSPLCGTFSNTERVGVTPS